MPSSARPFRSLAPLTAILIAAAARAADPSVLQQPAASPDGREVAFVTAGAIWTVPAGGGDAAPLVANLGDVLRPLYSPDGRRLAFVSARAGNADLYVLSFDTGDLKRLTVDDSPDRLDAWSADGKYLYFSTGGHEVGNTPDVYRVAVDGGTPMPVVAEPYGSDFYAAPAPDGHTVAFCGGGLASSQWWRHGHAHIDCCSIWTTDGAAKPTYTRQTDDASKHLWPMWSPDGKTLYFLSDEGGTENLYALPFATAATRPAATLPAATRPATQLTHFRDGRLLWPTISADGRTIVFERDFGLWKVDDAPTGAAGPIADPPPRARRRASAPQPAGDRPRRLGAGRLARRPQGGRRRPRPGVRRRPVSGAPTRGRVAGPRHPHRRGRGPASPGPPTTAASPTPVDPGRDTRHLYLYDFATRTERPLTRRARQRRLAGLFPRRPLDRLHPGRPRVARGRRRAGRPPAADDHPAGDDRAGHHRAWPRPRQPRPNRRPPDRR